jgi:hypothetical protein
MVLCPSEKPTLLRRYPIVGHDSKGLELPHFFLDSGEEVLPVFSSEEAAQEFLSLSPLGEASPGASWSRHFSAFMREWRTSCSTHYQGVSWPRMRYRPW